MTAPDNGSGAPDLFNGLILVSNQAPNPHMIYSGSDLCQAAAGASGITDNLGSTYSNIWVSDDGNIFYWVGSNTRLGNHPTSGDAWVNINGRTGSNSLMWWRWKL